MLSNVCYFLFTVVDGIFVGRGVGTNGLGAVNLVLPFTMIVMVFFMLINIGGATIFAVRIGRGDTEGANEAFRHGVILLSGIAVVLTVIGVFFADMFASYLAQMKHSTRCLLTICSGIPYSSFPPGFLLDCRLIAGMMTLPAWSELLLLYLLPLTFLGIGC